MNRRELEIFRKYLERRGLKLTSERQALFDEVFSKHEHVEADELLVRLRVEAQEDLAGHDLPDARAARRSGRRRESCASARPATATSASTPETTTTT